MKKSFLYGLVLCIFCYANVFAQDFDEARLEAITNEFIQRAESSDALSLMTNIKSYYASLSSIDKKKMLSFYVSKVSSLLENEKKNEALAVILLYQNLADKDDDKLPSLLFVKGNIYSERMDSIHLKQTIVELSDDNLKQKNSDFISTLSAKLNKIRTFVPPHKKIDGLWVADGLFWENSKKGNFGSDEMGNVDMFMQIDYDMNADTMSFCINNKSELALQMDLDMGRAVSIKK